MKRNKRLLLKAAQRIEDAPASFSMSTYRSKDHKAPCGTVACLAGEIIIASGKDVKEGLARLWDVESGEVASTAARMIGMPELEPMGVFGATARAWPKPYQTNYNKARSKRSQANAASAFLRYLADGGKVAE